MTTKVSLPIKIGGAAIALVLAGAVAQRLDGPGPGPGPSKNDRSEEVIFRATWQPTFVTAERIDWGTFVSHQNTPGRSPFEVRTTLPRGTRVYMHAVMPRGESVKDLWCSITVKGRPRHGDSDDRECYVEAEVN